MAYLNTDAILTAIRDVVEDAVGSARTIAATRFDGHLYSTLSDEEQSRRGLVRARVEARIISTKKNPHSPAKPGNISLYDLLIEILVVRHLNATHRLDDATRDTARGLAAQDADVLRQALCWPGNLTVDSGTNLTELVSGKLKHLDSEIGEAQIGKDKPGLITSRHRFSCIAKVRTQEADLLDLISDGTFTRASSAICLTSLRSSYGYSPMLIEQGTNSPRYQDRSDGNGRHLLIEGSATNAFRATEDMSATYHSGWSGPNYCTITTNVTLDPMGMIAADLVAADSSNTQHSIWRTPSTTLPNDTYCASVYYKLPTTNGASYILFATGNDNGHGVVVDTATNTVDDSAGVISSDIETISNGWYRINIVYAWTGDNRLFYISASIYDVVLPAPVVGTYASWIPTEAHDKSIYLWGFQGGETTSVGHGSSYIRNLGITASASRSADSVVIAAADIPSYILNGSWAIDAWPDFDSSGTYDCYLFSFDATNYMRMDNATGTRRVLLVAGGVTVATVSPAPSFSIREKLTFTFYSDYGEITVNGSMSSTPTPWTFPAATNLRFGAPSTGTANYFNGMISNPRRY